MRCACAARHARSDQEPQLVERLRGRAGACQSSAQSANGRAAVNYMRPRRRMFRRFYFYDQRAHADRLLIRHNVWPDSAAGIVVRRALLAGIDQIRRIGQRQIAESVATESLLSEAPIWCQEVPVPKIATNRLRLDWYTRHHADRLHTPHR